MFYRNENTERNIDPSFTLFFNLRDVTAHDDRTVTNRL